MKDYASMSDGEINYIVASVLFPVNLGISTPYNHRADAYIYHPNGTYSVKDYCNNPADAWPIITENRISIIHLDDNEWGCRGDGDKSACRAINSNALRCAMIVFLMMKEGE